jgi:hypothetical protein
MERSMPTDFVGVAQLRLFGYSSYWYNKCAQNTATGRGHYSSRLILSLCVQSSRLRPNQTLLHVLNLSPLSDLSSKSLKRMTTELGISSRYEITSSPGPYLVNYIASYKYSNYTET